MKGKLSRKVVTNPPNTKPSDKWRENGILQEITESTERNHFGIFSAISVTFCKKISLAKVVRGFPMRTQNGCVVWLPPKGFRKKDWLVSVPFGCEALRPL